MHRLGNSEKRTVESGQASSTIREAVWCSLLRVPTIQAKATDLALQEAEVQEVLMNVLEKPELGCCLKGPGPPLPSPRPTPVLTYLAAPRTRPHSVTDSPPCPLSAALSEAGLGALPDYRSSQPGSRGLPPPPGLSSHPRVNLAPDT